MISVMQNCVAEWAMTSSKEYANPFHEVSLHAEVTDPAGNLRRVPAFWGGGNTWRIRYSSALTGTHTLRTVCSDAENPTLHGCTGEIEITPYEGSNPLLLHGGIQKSADGRYLQHADGTPFFWLADTWWMGLTSRLSWPQGFQTLAQDRVQKGFTAVQIVAGLYPDMDPFDARGANEAGFPWDEQFHTINPAYFDAADQKIQCLVNSGLLPCIVACWGFFAKFAGVGVIAKHWEYLIARWGAYPVAWCMAGEANMPFYNDEDVNSGRISRKDYAAQSRKDWTEMTRHVRLKDPFQRLVTIHPTSNGHEQIEDETLLDLDMLQTGHSSYHSLLPTLRQVKAALDRKALPVINAEVCYEGICGSNGADVQRYVFWTCMLLGCCGHTYGANGIWQLNDEGRPYGPSPHGATWGDTPWQQAYRLPGSEQVGLGKKLLSRFDWWRFEFHPEWTESACSLDNLNGYFAAGIPGEVRVIFRPFLGGAFFGEDLVYGLEKDVRYEAFYFNPINGDERRLGSVTPDEEGTWRSPRVTAFQDWVLVMEKQRGAESC